MKNDIANSSFVQFEVWDFPGHVDTSSAAVKPESTYGGCGALVWVIDAQDDHAEAIARLQSTIVTAHRINPQIVFEIFIHKVDSLSDDQRIETQREIQNQLSDELATARVSQAKVNFHLTSIYDHSVFEAFSKVVQQLIPQLPTLQSLLDVLVTSCRIDKAFLFDVVSKIYVATDSSPVDMQSYELCAVRSEPPRTTTHRHAPPRLPCSGPTDSQTHRGWHMHIQHAPHPTCLTGRQPVETHIPRVGGHLHAARHLRGLTLGLTLAPSCEMRAGHDRRGHRRLLHLWTG